MGEAEKRAAMEVLDSDVLSAFLGSAGSHFNGGPKVRDFEETWAKRYGFAHAVSVNSWTSGLITAVGACGIGPGDEVVCSPFTMSASATCAMFYGGIPVFADIDATTWNLDPESVLSRITPRTKAIVVVHLFGLPAEMDEILEIARRHDLRVIEDAAQAPGTYYKGKATGAIGDIGGFSLNFHKHIHVGEGGMIVTQDEALADRSRRIRNHGENATEGLARDDLANVIGQNYRLTELQAAIGKVQLQRLDGYLAHRQALARHFHSRLQEFPCLASYPEPDDRTHAYYVFPFCYDADRAGLARNLFVRAVAAELPEPSGFESTPIAEGYVQPLYWARIYQERTALKGGYPFAFNPDVVYQYEKGLCPVAERMYERDLLLTPLVREPLTTSDLDDVVSAFEKVLGQAGEIQARLGSALNKDVFTPAVATDTSDVR